VKSTTTNPPPASGTYFWKFTSGGKISQGEVDGDGELEVISAGGLTFTTVAFSGISNSPDTSLIVAIADKDGVINANESYVSTATTTNSAGIVVDLGGIVYQADPQTTGSNVTVKVTSHNTTTKIIAGTFTGTLKNPIGTQTLTITNGEFKFHYL
jgi:hypothetical protein